MLTQIFGDSATEAAWWGAIGQGLGAVATAVAVVIALWLPMRADRRATAERRTQLAGDAMASVLDLMTAVEAVRIRAYGRPGRWATLLGIYMNLFAAGWPRKEQLAAALFRANDVNVKLADFAYTAISGPSARCYSALAQVSLCGSEDMRLAADELRKAVAELLMQFGDKRTYAKACRKLDDAVAGFRAVTIKVTGAAER